MPTPLAGLDPLVALSGGEAAAAILTTDLVDKQALEADLQVAACGLVGWPRGRNDPPRWRRCWAFRDAGVEPSRAGDVRRAVQRSFNAITVDGDTSTNDTVLTLRGGEALPEDQLDALEDGLTAAMQHLPSYCRDRGATCLIEVQVEEPG